VVTVRFKSTPYNPCPAAMDTPAERAAWSLLRGHKVVLLKPVSQRQLRNTVCGSDTYWMIRMDERVKQAAGCHPNSDKYDYAVCRHVLDMGD
jgi:hypothetical protein